MAFVHGNGQTGALSAPLQATDTTMKLGSAWTAASGTAKLAVDPPLPGQSSPTFEIVYATVTQGSATATALQRGQEGTTASGHGQGATWLCGPTGADLDVLAPLDNPTFTGTVTVPTPSLPGAAATKQYVDTAVSTGGVVSSVFGRTGAVVAQTGDYTAAQVGAFANPMTTAGDLIVGGASGAATRLAQGGNGTFLGVSGGVLGYFSAGVSWPLTNTGDETFQPNSIANNALTLHNNASAVNGVTVTGAATGAGAFITASGSDTNIGINITSKGIGSVELQSGSSVWTFASSGNLTFPGGAGAINFQNPGMTLSSTTLRTTGGSFQVGLANSVDGVVITEANPPTIANAPGNGVTSHDLYVSGAVAPFNTGLGGSVAGQIPLTAATVASGVNGVTIAQAVAGSAPSMAATGSDTNIDLTIGGKGTGVIRFGYASVAVSGVTPATLGNTGGGPATATQYGWRATKNSDGTVEYVPVWR